jgi:hypothetical protein
LNPAEQVLFFRGRKAQAFGSQQVFFEQQQGRSIAYLSYWNCTTSSSQHFSRSKAMLHTSFFTNGLK